MDRRLSEALNRLSKQIDTVHKVEASYLSLEAASKSHFATLLLAAEGKTVSEREAQVYASEEWKLFAKGLAEAEASFHRERARLELYTKGYDAEHLSYKMQGTAIQRGAG